MPIKISVTSGSNMICSQTPGNLFPSCKLKGNHPFTARAVTIGSVKHGADSGAKGGEEGETEPLADEEVKALGRMEETGQPMEYIVCFAKAVKLYQQKKRSCFRCRGPNHLMWDCPKDISKSAWEVDINTKEGIEKKGGLAPQKSAVTQQSSPEETS